MKTEADLFAVRFAQLCLRGRKDSDCLKSAGELAMQPGFDWDALLHFAYKGKLSPLLYHTLRGRQILPSPIARVLREDYAYTSRRNLFLLHELDLVLKLLSDAGVNTIVLKGAMLAEIIYKNIALRPMADLDILVEQEQVPAATKILTTEGYRLVNERHPGDTFAYENNAELVKEGLEFTSLEVHWSLFDSPYYQSRLPLDWFWDSARPAIIGQVPLKILGPEALLLHLCGHLMLHHPHAPRLLWLNDVAEVIHYYRTNLDWDLLIDRAQRYQLLLSLQNVLTEVTQILGAPVPEPVLARCNSLYASADERRVFALRTSGEKSLALHVWADLVNISGTRNRLRFLLARLFPTPSYMLSRYKLSNRILLPFYYFYRLFVGLGSIGKLLISSKMARIPLGITRTKEGGGQILPSK